MIETTKGQMDEALLEKRTGIDEDDRARIEWVEYWLEGEMVHRSASIAIKKGVVYPFSQGVLGG